MVTRTSSPGHSVPGSHKQNKRTRSAVSLALVVLLLGTFASMLPSVVNEQEVEAAKVKTVLEVVHLGFVIYEVAAFGGETAKEHLVPDPAEEILEEVKKQGILIDEVQSGLNEIQQELAGMYEELNLYDRMANAWDQIPNIQLWYTKLNQEIDKPHGTVPKELLDEWANGVTEGANVGDAVGQFHAALTQQGAAADQQAALIQMRDRAFNELAGVSATSDFSTTVESTNGVGIIAERPMYFNYQGQLTGGSCQSGILNPAKTFYFAEGTVRPGFHSFICVQNPGNETSPVKITYMKGDGSTAEQNIFVRSKSRATVNVNDFFGLVNGPPADFSAKVESIGSTNIVAERPMYFNYNGAWDGGHVNAGITEPSTSLFFAEGSTRPGFDSFFCVQNPDSRDAAVSITYMKADGVNQRQDLVVPAHTRSTVRASDTIGQYDGEACDFSAKVESTNGVGIVAERPMYFAYKGSWTGGHCQGGATESSPNQYFAEGTTRPNFDSYICLQNPSTDPAQVQVDYMLGDGSNKTQQVTVPGNRRATVRASDVLGQADSEACDFSAKVTSTNGVGIIAERPMYFDYGGKWNGGHDEAGTRGPAGKFHFAEGTVRPGFDTYLCLQNPEDKEAKVRVTFMKGNDTTQVEDITVPPRSRYTLPVGDTYQGATLTEVYEKNLQSFFEQCLYYQVIGAVTYANALDYLHPGDPVYSGQAWLNNTYLKTYMKNESDLFWSCVEQLVMSQADVNQYGWGTNINYLKLPSEAGEIFESADLLRKIAMGQLVLPDTGTTVNGGICGRIVGAQDAVPKGQIPAIKVRSSAGTQYSPTFSEPGGDRTHEQEVSWLSTSKVQQKYDCWSAASGTDKTVSISGYWSMPRYQFDPSGGFADGSYTVLSPTGSTLGTATVSKTPFPDPRDNSKTLNLSYGSFVVPWRNNRLACDPAQWSVREAHTDNCNPDPTTSFQQEKDKGVQGIWMKISNANNDDYKKEQYIESNAFSSPVNLPVRFTVSVNLGTQSSSGQQKSSYGYVFSDIDWYTDDAQAKVHYQVYLKDLTTGGVLGTVIEESKSVDSDSGKYTKDANFGHSSKSNTISATLAANHRYQLVFKLDGEVIGDEGGAVGGGGGDAEVNQKATVTSLGVMSP